MGTELESETSSQIGWGYLLVSISLTGMTLSEVSLSLRSKAKKMGSVAALAAAPGCGERSRARRTGAMMDLNIIAGKPVFVEIKRKAAENDGQRDQRPLFARHKR